MDGMLVGVNPVCLVYLDRFKFLEWAAREGFEAVEILSFRGAVASVGPTDGFWPEEVLGGGEAARRLREVLSRFEFVAVHAPFVDLHPLSHNPRIASESRGQIEAALHMAAELGARTVTVHASPKTGYRLSDYWDELIGLLRRLGDLAGELGLSVGVETGWPPGEEDFFRLIEEAAHPAVGVCFDVGHVVFHLPAGARERRDKRALNETAERMIRRLGPRVVNVHVHDVRASDFRDHREVGTGVLDFRPILTALFDCGYKGPLVLELEEPDEGAIKRSAARLREILRSLEPPGQAG